MAIAQPTATVATVRELASERASERACVCARAPRACGGDGVRCAVVRGTTATRPAPATATPAAAAAECAPAASASRHPHPHLLRCSGVCAFGSCRPCSLIDVVCGSDAECCSGGCERVGPRLPLSLLLLPPPLSNTLAPVVVVVLLLMRMLPRGAPTALTSHEEHAPLLSLQPCKQTPGAMTMYASGSAVRRAAHAQRMIMSTAAKASAGACAG